MMNQFHLGRFRVMTQGIELREVFALFCERRKSRYANKQKEYCGSYQDALVAMTTHQLTSFPTETEWISAESGLFVQQSLGG